MTVKQHYDNHLGNFYTWMIGDFEQKKNEFLQFCRSNKLFPADTKTAIDLGAGHGIQSITLAELGFEVTAIDFNRQLLSELDTRKGDLPIQTLYGDLQNPAFLEDQNAELIVCCGDTITHLQSIEEITGLLKNIYQSLQPKGKIVLSFRDYSNELIDTSRFIPVKSDASRILTCFLECRADKIRVTDLVHEKIGEIWEQKASSYEKTRINRQQMREILIKTGFEMVLDEMEKGMVNMIGKK